MDGSPYPHGHNQQQQQLTWGCSCGLDQNMGVSIDEEGHHHHSSSSHIIFHEHQQQQHELNHHLSSFDYPLVWPSDLNNIYHPAFSLQTSSHHAISPHYSSNSSLLVVGSVGHQLVGLAGHHHQQLHRLQYHRHDEEEEEEVNQQRELAGGGGGAGGDHEDEGAEEEDLGAMKEMMYNIAAMQPVDIDPSTIRKPKRRNVRISDDPQSVAARHRRERISEKMRILQRLVPGGTKMDTSSMLDEAIRYVKFLKRQIKRLQLEYNNDDPQLLLPPRPSLEKAAPAMASCVTAAANHPIDVISATSKQQCIKYGSSAVSGAATNKTTTSIFSRPASSS